MAITRTPKIWKWFLPVKIAERISNYICFLPDRHHSCNHWINPFSARWRSDGGIICDREMWIHPYRFLADPFPNILCTSGTQILFRLTWLLDSRKRWTKIFNLYLFTWNLSVNFALAFPLFLVFTHSVFQGIFPLDKEIIYSTLPNFSSECTSDDNQSGSSCDSDKEEKLEAVEGLLFEMGMTLNTSRTMTSLFDQQFTEQLAMISLFAFVILWLTDVRSGNALWKTLG